MYTAPPVQPQQHGSSTVAREEKSRSNMGHCRKGGMRVHPGQLKRNWWAPHLISQILRAFKLCGSRRGGIRHLVVGCAIGGAQWQTYPTLRGAQSPRNAAKQLLENQGAQWSHVGTVPTTPTTNTKTTAIEVLIEQCGREWFREHASAARHAVAPATGSPANYSCSGLLPK